MNEHQSQKDLSSKPTPTSCQWVVWGKFLRSPEPQPGHHCRSVRCPCHPSAWWLLNKAWVSPTQGTGQQLPVHGSAGGGVSVSLPGYVLLGVEDTMAGGFGKQRLRACVCPGAGRPLGKERSQLGSAWRRDRRGAGMDDRLVRFSDARGVVGISPAREGPMRADARGPVRSASASRRRGPGY